MKGYPLLAKLLPSSKKHFFCCLCLCGGEIPSWSHPCDGPKEIWYHAKKKNKKKVENLKHPAVILLL